MWGQAGYHGNFLDSWWLTLGLAAYTRIPLQPPEAAAAATAEGSG